MRVTVGVLGGQVDCADMCCRAHGEVTMVSDNLHEIERGVYNISIMTLGLMLMIVFLIYQ